MTAPQINEKLKEKIKEAIDCIEIPNEKGGYDSFNSVSKNSCSVLLDEIMSLIPQPEQLEVEILSRANIDDRPNRWLVKYKYATLDYFLTEQKAIDFCKRFNLKVTNEPEGGVK